jgi:hypothetical protein
VVFNDTEPLYEIPTSLSVVFFIMYITIVLLGTVASLFSFSYLHALINYKDTVLLQNGGF